MNIFKYTLLSLFILFSFATLAQHHQHEATTTESERDSLTVMSHGFSLSLPMNRNGSGTSWLPDATPMYGYMKHTPEWMYMVHGSIFLRYNYQDIGEKGKRGGRKFDAPNWFMFMAQRRVGKRGLFRFSTMLSLDPLTVGGAGYPLLFQSGETWKGKRLVDRQHPHDLLSELSVGYTHMINPNMDIFAYLAYPGEPALGPTAFMHRISSFHNPDSPLGHHWQDATHILFGVGTLGLRYKIVKLEGSLFTGREPDENRYNFDTPRFDSYSYRVTVNPNPYLSIQASRAFIKSPEPLDPDINVDRTTASVAYSMPLAAKNSFWTSTLAWGLNSHHGANEHSLLLESNLQLWRNALYGRYEIVQKSAEELALEEMFEHHRAFTINALTVGTSRIIVSWFNTYLSAGIQGSVYFAEETLNPVYGKNPLAAQIYLHLTPGLMRVSMPKRSKSPSGQQDDHKDMHHH